MWIETENGFRLEGAEIEVVRAEGIAFPWAVWEHGIRWRQCYDTAKAAQRDVETALKRLGSMPVEVVEAAEGLTALAWGTYGEPVLKLWPEVRDRYSDREIVAIGIALQTRLQRAVRKRTPADALVERLDPERRTVEEMVR